MSQPDMHRQARIDVSWHDCAVGCLACLKICPEDVLTEVAGKVDVSSACSRCGLCETACPRGAIRTVGDRSPAQALVDLAHRIVAGKDPYFTWCRPGETEQVSSFAWPWTPEMQAFADAMDLVPDSANRGSMPLSNWAEQVLTLENPAFRELLFAAPALRPYFTNGDYGRVHLGSISANADCTLCGACISSCSSHAFQFTASGNASLALVFYTSRCTGCTDCIKVCPEKALQLDSVVESTGTCHILKTGSDHTCPECGDCFDVEETVREVARLLTQNGQQKAAEAIQLCNSCRGQHYQAL